MSPRMEGPDPRLRRVYWLRRILVLLITLSLGFLSFYVFFLDELLYGRPQEDSIRADPLQVVEWQVEGREVRVAAYMPEGVSQDDARRGLLKIYEWSQQFHPSVECGSATDEDCSVGSTTIVLLTSSEVQLVNGQRAQAYVITAELQLNQFLISQLLARPPETLDDFLSWHGFAENVGAGSFENLPGEPFLSLTPEE